jgi:hypothetical protein
MKPPLHLTQHKRVPSKPYRASFVLKAPLRREIIMLLHLTKQLKRAMQDDPSKGVLLVGDVWVSMGAGYQSNSGCHSRATYSPN